MRPPSWAGPRWRLYAFAMLAATCAVAAGPPDASPSVPADVQSTRVEPVYGPELEGFEYPYPVLRFAFESQQSQMQMAYLDVAPDAPNGRTVVLLHGKNFCAGTWAQTIAALVRAGYRVVAPDQIGFCKSTKPDRYQYTFHQLASNTKTLLEAIGVDRFTLVGHSTGGMLAVRFALMFPAQLEQLVLVNPVGLEDWQAKGVPAPTIDQWYRREMGVTAQRIRAYEQATYYAGEWRAEFDAPVQMLAGMYRGSGHDKVAWNSALVYDMIFNQPVVYELGGIKTPTLLLIGQRDTTAIGKDFAPPQVTAALGNYAQLGRLAARRIPTASLIEFPGAGHAPQIQIPDEFNRALIEGIETRKPSPEPPR